MPSFDAQVLKGKPRNFVDKRLRKPWRAYLYRNGKRIYLGNFASREEAADREHIEKLRVQNELLKEFPNDIQTTRQQRLL